LSAMLNQIYAKHTGQTADTIGATHHVPEASSEAQQSALPVHKLRTSPPRKLMMCCADIVNALTVNLSSWALQSILSACALAHPRRAATRQGHLQIGGRGARVWAPGRGHRAAASAPSRQLTPGPAALVTDCPQGVQCSGSMKVAHVSKLVNTLYSEQGIDKPYQGLPFPCASIACAGLGANSQQVKRARNAAGPL